MTINDLSFTLRISYVMLSRWELQKFQPSPKNQVALEKCLGKDLFVYNTPTNGKNTKGKDK